ncbi:hypothetical protein [Lacimicrobium alkaliphilum]|uniref:Uncharacterized protein n=1 Tax=Lacimicrobium alkaliphilum TaxID=1526571 RepID=A0ABQ1RCF3_9ALTE|nr:hypothetical protein [Lacimicrobium alkaliphilum]GGD65053.1 hypothetical protein GCM10011357_20530 [Lacimicrobium alkaliphilum]
MLIQKQEHTLCWHTSFLCPQCRSNSIDVEGKGSYLALGIVGLPLMALSTNAEGHCRDCNWQSEVRSVWQYKGAILWPWLVHWVGRSLGLLLLLLAGLWFWQMQVNEAQRVQKMLTQPKVDDFYFVDMREFKQDTHPKYPYTVLRVIKTDAEALLLRVGNIYHSQQVSPWRHFKADAAMQRNFYSRYTLSLTTSALRALSERGIIYSMRRPKNLSSDGWIVLPQAQPGTEMPRLQPFLDKPEYRIEYPQDCSDQAC